MKNNSTEKKTDRIIRKKELLAITGLSNMTIYRHEKDGKFPKRLCLGGSARGWLKSEVDAWLEERAAAR